ncbi:6-phosphogluconolactonase [Propionivibrio sp.]|uniref:6-phosphogluconolactonase n=1 Tax=Propionivibrio sp. TaxID=2212460 RepID=UPI003BF3187B
MISRQPARLDAASLGASLQRCRLHPQLDLRALQEAVVEWILSAAATAVSRCGKFQLVLAGGETPRDVYQKLRQADADWSGWHIYFGDERCLPAEDAARNSRMAGEAWLDHVPIPAAQIHAIPAELGAGRAAEAYAASLREVGDFDLVLLGLGEDGHTASLFPGNYWGTSPEAPATLAVCNAPKPPAERVSLSAARLSRARQVLFLISGEAKRGALADWRAGKEIPARSIAPAAGVDVLLEAALLRRA